MRTIINIEKEKLQALTILAQQHHVSRAMLIREAINNLLESSAKQEKYKDVFGILKGRHKVEGLAFQKKLRSEWD